jgi:hypothetical protein
MLPLSIIGCIYYINNTNKIENTMKEKYTSFIWNTISYIFDAMYLIIFIYLNYKILFVMYITYILFSITLKVKINELMKNNKEK